MTHEVCRMIQQRIYHTNRSNHIYKSPVLVGILSFLPGLGQVYVGYYRHGFIHGLIFALAIAFAQTLPAQGLNVMFRVMIPFFIFLISLTLYSERNCTIRYWMIYLKPNARMISISPD